MPEQPQNYSRPELPNNQASGAITIWAVLTPTGIGILLFFYMLFGPAIIYLGLFIMVVAGIGGLHYWMWGRQMEAAPDDTAAPDPKID